MTRHTELENLIQVQTALSEKYRRRAVGQKSKPLKAKLIRRAEFHRRKAVQLGHGLTP